MNIPTFRFRGSTAVLVALASISLQTLLQAQFDAAEVLGTIRDGSGGVVAKASVMLTNQDTGIQTSTQTDENGNYTFSNVKIGAYTITAEAAGFSKMTATDIRVNVNARQRVDLSLQVGAVNQAIEVTGAASMVESDSSERGQVVNRITIVELPLNGRAYSDLALLTTGVIKSPSASSREGSFNVNGLRSTYNNYLLDGIDNNAYGTSNQGFANQAAQPSPDSVAEFKVITNNYSAEYGHSGGATVDVAMRSGTNQIHGTAYDFLRNTELNAIGYTFGARPATFMKPTLQQNQFGGTISGPIVKNRLFFFADYEGLRVLQRSRTFASLPSLSDRAGNLPVAVVNPLTGVVYQAHQPIPMTAFAQHVLNDLPAPQIDGRSNNFQQLSLNQNYADKYDVKLDYQINDRMSSFLRLSQSMSDQSSDSSFPGPSGGNGALTHIYNDTAAIGYTWTVSPNSVLESRVGVAHTAAGKKPPFTGGPDMLQVYGVPGLPSDPVISGGLLPISLSGFTGLGRQATSPQFQNPLSFDYKVNFSKIMGRHAVKVGYEFIPIRVQVLDVNPMYGADSYLGSFSKPSCAQLGLASNCSVPVDAASYSLADFLFGARSAYSLATDVIGNYRQHEHFLYVQDDFHVSSKLTVNIGLRWEFATPRWERDNVLSNFDPTSNTMLLAKNGSLYDRTLINPDYKDFAPRVGFAYSFMPKTVVRGGYGISYVHQNRMGSGDLLGINGPQVVISTVNQTPSDPTFVPSQQGYPLGLTDPKNFNPRSANVLYIPRDLRTPYVQSWFFSIQRELPWKLLLDLGYIGNHSVALPVMGDYNQAAPQPTPTSNLSLQARRPDQAFSAVSWLDPAGFSSYNALQVKLERRLSGGLLFLNSFTWSKAIDNSTQALDGLNGNQASVQDIHNLASERGLSAYDKKFVDVFSVVYQVPVGRGRKFGSSMPGFFDQFVGGWEVSAINSALSAPPIDLRAWSGSVPPQFQTVGNLAEWKGGEAFRPNVFGPVLAADPTVDNFYNKDNVKLSTDPSHPFGNAPRNFVRALPLNQLDLGIHKEFHLPLERMRLQFRGEMFNALNHTNFTGPNSDVASTAFGTIRSTYAPRQIQFALKLMF
ncbi:MAG: TonB-dependent receptor [Acidobacteriia bacterium]|nr:TonB-dependent receptor [Terriglobia bacterium]